MEQSEKVTTTEAAEILGVSTARIRRMLLDGFFEGVEKFGTNNAIPLSEVERVKNERRAAGRPAKEKAVK